MRDICNQSVKKRHGGNEAVGWGREKKADAAKKGIFKARDGIENPGEGAAGALVFLGINMTELLVDQRRLESQ